MARRPAGSPPLCWSPARCCSALARPAPAPTRRRLPPRPTARASRSSPTPTPPPMPPQQIGGDRVDVVLLTKPGVEPHDLELSADQVRQIADADLVAYIPGLVPAVQDAAKQEAPDRSVDVTIGHPAPAERPARVAGPAQHGPHGHRHRRRADRPPPRLVLGHRRPDLGDDRAGRPVPGGPAARAGCACWSSRTPRSATSPTPTTSSRRRSPGSPPRPSRAPPGWPS